MTKPLDLTTRQVCEAFGVSHVTIHKWRGKPNDPLPVIKIAGNKIPAIRFDLEAITQWAQRNNKPFNFKETE